VVVLFYSFFYVVSLIDLLVMITLVLLDAATGACGSSCHGRVRDELITQDAVRSVRSERRIQARSYR